MSGKFWLGVVFAPTVLPALPAIAAGAAISKIAGKTQERVQGRKWIAKLRSGSVS